MRKLLKLLLILLPILAIAYTGFWYYQAYRAKDLVESAIKNINDRVDSQLPFITYASLATSGFPGNVYVNINQPVIKGRADRLMHYIGEEVEKRESDRLAKQAQTEKEENLAANAEGKVVDEAQIIARQARDGMKAQERARLINLLKTTPEWYEESAVDGVIQLGINIYSNAYFINMWGDVKTVSKLNGKEFRTISKSEVKDSPMNCVLDISWSQDIALAFLGLGDKDILDKVQADFESFSCIGAARYALDAKTKQTIATAKELELKVLNNSPGVEDGRLDGSFYLNMPFSQTSEYGDLIIAEYYKMFSRVKGSSAPKISIYGAQSLFINASFSGPDFIEGKHTGNVNLAAVIQVSNALYDTNVDIKFDAAEINGETKGTLSLKSDAAFKKGYNNLMKLAVHDLIFDIYSDEGTQAQMVLPFIGQYKPEQLYAIVLPALPDFESLGSMRQSAELTFAVKAVERKGTGQLTNFEVSFYPYGISAEGSMQQVPNTPKVTSTLAIGCRNCMQLVDDAAAYNRRLEKVMAYFIPQDGSENMSPERVDGMKSFLLNLAGAEADTKPEIINYQIDNDGAGNITINGRPLKQVMSQYYRAVPDPVRGSSRAPGK